MIKEKQVEIGGRTLKIQTGHAARQADGAVFISYGGTVVLATAVSSKESDPLKDFLPLTVDYREKAYAAGKIPGGFFKREGRPGDRETLTARMIDRPIRPLFPEGYNFETQVIGMVFSADQENDPDILAITGASAALLVSDIPFDGPVSAVRVGKQNGEFIINPSIRQLEESDLNIVVCGSMDAIVMVEGEGEEIDESMLVDALEFAHEHIKTLNELQIELQKEAGKPKRQIEPLSTELETAENENRNLEQIFHDAKEEFKAAIKLPSKHDSKIALDKLEEKLSACFVLEEDIPQAIFKRHFHDYVRQFARDIIINENQRPDGRNFDGIRNIDCQAGVFPMTHGSAMFRRGETQAMVITTLGTKSDEQIVDNLMGESYKTFMLHYNFLPFSVGEARFLRGPARREIGHGALAERSIHPIIPDEEKFPYTLRVVSDILESNGSSSMASVCGASMALMDAGVPVSAAVSGIAMGLVIEGSQYAILSDITGMEDHYGDMDFKVAGTRQGITAVQMDIKVKGLSSDILREALEQAKKGRLHILDSMDSVIPSPRADLSPHAPRIISMKIDPEKIAAVIGPQGKMIRKIIADTGVKIDIEDDGTVIIASVNKEAGEKAAEIVNKLTEVPEIGKEYKGIVKRLENYGAFIEILPGTDGLLHISNVSDRHVKDIRDEMKIGDEVEVKVLGIDHQGKVKLIGKGVTATSDSGRRSSGGRGDRRNYRGSRDRRSGGRDSRGSDRYKSRDRRDDRSKSRRSDRRDSDRDDGRNRS